MRPTSTSASVGAPADADVVALEAAAARGWPAPDTAEVDGWLLRAADGTFTARANSAVPVDVTAVAGVTAQLRAGARVPDVVSRIDAWYRERGLPTRLALPVPTMAPLRERLAAHGWTARGPTHVMTSSVRDLLHACIWRDDLPPVRVTDHLDDPWLRVYERGDQISSPLRRAILDGGGARFATLHLDGAPAAIVRTTVDGSWVGIAPVEVASAHRRRGLARHLLAWAMSDATERGATRVWLQVEDHNVAAVSLYRRLGMQTHHAYWYDTPPDQGGRS